MTGQSLLASALAAPDDDLPRLVLADWCDENAQPERAEFIRTQVALHRDCCWLTGLPLTSDERRHLENRDRHLTTVMTDACGPDIAGWVRSGDPLWRLTFDRGLIRSLHLPHSPVVALPDGLGVTFDLALYCTSVRELPAGLCVGRDLALRETSVRELPDGLWVGRNLSLRDTRQLDRLPDGLRVRGNLTLAGSGLTRLPVGLRVGRDLNLRGTRLTALPDDLVVGGDLDLTGVPLNLTAVGDLLEFPGLSAEAKASGLWTAGYGHLAALVEDRAGGARRD